jgi:hypothetical protein
MVAPTGNVDPVSAEQDDAGDAPRTLPLIGLFLRSPRRRPFTAAGALLVGTLATAAVAALFPRTYVVEAKILAQKHSTIPLLTIPHRPSSNEPEAPPTRAAGETILKRDSLVTIEREAHLDERWSNERTPLGKIMDRVFRANAAPPPAEEQSRMILGTLEKRIAVTTDDNTIKITVNWHQAETAYLIAAAALKSFLKDKSDQEAGAINESAAIVEQEAARQRDVLASTLSNVQKIRRAAIVQSTEAASATAAHGVTGVSGVVALPQTSAEITALLAEKRHAIQLLEEARQRRLADLRVQLEDLRATLTPAHPSVLAMEEKIRQATAPLPELQSLKQAEAEILAQIKGAAPAVSPMAAPAAAGEGASTAARVILQHGEDAELSTARAKLSVAVQRYEELMERLDATRLELLSEQAAFKYRYVVMVPPELPKQAAKPSLPLVVALGALGSVLLAFLAAGLRDLLSGRFVEIWQVQGKLPIPLIAEVDDP